MSDPFFVLSTPGAVEVWSTVRLPFEPRGWLVDLRSQLRDALTDLCKTSSGRLHAIYSAVDNGAFVDIENVLLYNVGGTALRFLTKKSVTFERGYQVPLPPSGAGFEDIHGLHYHRYSHASQTLVTPLKGRLLGEFFDVPVGAVDKPAPVWKAIRENAAPPMRTASEPTRFLINVNIVDTRPRGDTGSVFSIIKPVLDGIISVYHSHHGSDGVAETELLSAMGLDEPAITNEMLFDRYWATLGARRLLRPFGASGVQWNPADDFCVYAHVTLNTEAAFPDNRQARWRLTAELSEAPPSR